MLDSVETAVFNSSRPSMNHCKELWELFYQRGEAAVTSSIKTIKSVCDQISAFLRKSSGALHHGNEPLLVTGAGVPDAVSRHASAHGHAARRPETSHPSQQELPGSAAGPGPAEEEETQTVCPALRNRDRTDHVMNVLTSGPMRFNSGRSLCLFSFLKGTVYHKI